LSTSTLTYGEAHKTRIFSILFTADIGKSSIATIAYSIQPGEFRVTGFKKQTLKGFLFFDAESELVATTMSPSKVHDTRSVETSIIAHAHP